MSDLEETSNLPAVSPDFSCLDEPLPLGEAGDITLVNLPADGIDPRLKLLSHSSRTTLHKCPRKYQLYRLGSDQVAMEDEKETQQAVTFAYGTAVGVGVQAALEDKTEGEVLIETFLSWDTDILDVDPKRNKSVWLALFAVQKFISLRAEGFLEDYELVYYTDPVTGVLAPAIELAFQIILPEGYKYRGFVDAVLKNKHTGEILVLECKTSSGTANPSMYKNSGQALGYSVVLDLLFPDLSSYVVMYLVYETRAKVYKELPFTKSLLQRALWLQELIIDTNLIEVYGGYDVYPQHGESCFDFFRDCEYLGVCTLGTEKLTKPLTQGILDRIEKDEQKYTFSIGFEELLDSQIAKGTDT